MKTELHTLSLGKIAYTAKARRNEVVIKLELRRGHSVGSGRDVDLNPCQTITELSLVGIIRNATGTDWASGGQNYDELAELFPDNKRVQRIVEIWKRWHLNGMRAGTRRQQEILDNYFKDNPYKPGPKGHYELSCEVLEETGLLVDRDYKYGSAWLAEPLPPEIEKEILELFRVSEVK